MAAPGAVTGDELLEVGTATGPPPAGPRSWWGTVLLVLGGLVYLALGDLVVLLTAVAVLGGRPGPSAVVLAAAATTPVALSFLWLVRRWNRLPRPPPAVSHGRAVATILIATSVAFAGVAVLSLVHAALGVRPQEQAPIVSAVRSLPPWQVYLALGWLGPLGEELFFRRFAFTSLRHRWGRVVGHAGAALVFAIVHFNFGAIAIYAFLGLVLSFAYERTGRLYVPTVIHGINNTVVVTALLYG